MRIQTRPAKTPHRSSIVDYSQNRSKSSSVIKPKPQTSTSDFQQHTFEEPQLSLRAPSSDQQRLLSSLMSSSAKSFPRANSPCNSLTSSPRSSSSSSSSVCSEPDQLAKIPVAAGNSDAQTIKGSIVEESQSHILQPQQQPTEKQVQPLRRPPLLQTPRHPPHPPHHQVNMIMHGGRPTPISAHTFRPAPNPQAYPPGSFPMYRPPHLPFVPMIHHHPHSRIMVPGPPPPPHLHIQPPHPQMMRNRLPSYDPHAGPTSFFQAPIVSGIKNKPKSGSNNDLKNELFALGIMSGDCNKGELSFSTSANNSQDNVRIELRENAFFE